MIKTISSVLALTLIASGVTASPILFRGVDSGAQQSDPRPNATAARAAWGASPMGPVSTIDFEQGSLNYLGPLSVAVRLDSNTRVASAVAEVTNVSRTPTLGYNTTAGGFRYMTVQPAFGALSQVSFFFDQPISAWGAFFTGVEAGLSTDPADPGSTKILAAAFSPGSATPQQLPVIGDTAGGVMFWGFTSDTPFTRLDLQITVPGGARDVFGIDDIVWAMDAPSVLIPLPSAGMLGLGGLLVVAGRRRRA